MIFVDDEDLKVTNHIDDGSKRAVEGEFVTRGWKAHHFFHWLALYNVARYIYVH